MVLGEADFPDGATTASVSPAVDSTFGITDVPSSSAFTRRFRAVRFRSLEAPQLISSVFVAKSRARASGVLAELGTITHPGATRRIMMEALRGGLGADMTASFIRARTLHAGDAAVELVFRITSKAVAFDIAEVWVRDGSAVSATAVIAAPRDFTLGDGIELAKLVAGRIESAA